MSVSASDVKRDLIPLEVEVVMGWLGWSNVPSRIASALLLAAVNSIVKLRGGVVSVHALDWPKWVGLCSMRICVVFVGHSMLFQCAHVLKLLLGLSGTRT